MKCKRQRLCADDHLLVEMSGVCLPDTPPADPGAGRQVLTKTSCPPFLRKADRLPSQLVVFVLCCA